MALGGEVDDGVGRRRPGARRRPGRRCRRGRRRSGRPSRRRPRPRPRFARLPGVGQLVEDGDPGPVAAAQDVADEAAPDEPGAAGDQEVAPGRRAAVTRWAAAGGGGELPLGVRGGGQLGGPQQRGDRARVGPVPLVAGRVEAAVGDVVVEDVGDLELAAAGRRQRVDDVEGVRAEEVDPDRDEVALRAPPASPRSPRPARRRPARRRRSAPGRGPGRGACRRPRGPPRTPGRAAPGPARAGCCRRGRSRRRRRRRTRGPGRWRGRSRARRAGSGR